MRFISVDVEANQPTNKIIQIGAAAFDTDSKTPSIPIDQFVLYLNPAEQINWDYDLKNGLTLLELLGEDFRIKWNQRNTISQDCFEEFWTWAKEVQCGKKFIQWGRGDMHEICSQSKALGISYPSQIQEVNLKRFYQFFYQPGLRLCKSPGGLEAACATMKISFEGRAHDALVDATNTGVLAVKMYQVIRGFVDIQNITGRVEL